MSQKGWLSEDMYNKKHFHLTLCGRGRLNAAHNPGGLGTSQVYNNWSENFAQIYHETKI